MKEIPFEKAMEKLEKIVGELEEGKLPLEDAIARYEEGIKLADLCREKLQKAKQKIELLTKDKKGKFVKKDLEENV